MLHGCRARWNPETVFDQEVLVTQRLVHVVLPPGRFERSSSSISRRAMRLAAVLACLAPFACAPGEKDRDGSEAADVHAGAPPAAATPADSLAVLAAVERFDSLLAAGDSAGALALLAPDAVILESGGMETREEYRSHHLPADIQFVRAVPSVRGPTRAVVSGDAAWVTATSTTQGTFRNRPVNSAGAALIVLTRQSEGWRIRAIHWSSHTRKP